MLYLVGGLSESDGPGLEVVPWGWTTNPLSDDSSFSSTTALTSGLLELPNPFDPKSAIVILEEKVFFLL